MANPKAIIADDEEQLILSLKSNLRQLWPELVICGQATNGIDALKLIDTHRPDIAFLDIKMPGCSGIEVAASLPLDQPKVIFCTAYDQYAIKAFEINALDYLLKLVNLCQ